MLHHFWLWLAAPHRNAICARRHSVIQSHRRMHMGVLVGRAKEQPRGTLFALQAKAKNVQFSSERDDLFYFQYPRAAQDRTSVYCVLAAQDRTSVYITFHAVK